MKFFSNSASISQVFSFMVFCFYAFVLFVSDSASFFAALLVALSIFAVFVADSKIFNGGDRYFAFWLALYPLLMIPSVMIKGGTWKYFDYPIRALLFIPLIAGLRGIAKPKSFQKSMYLGCNVGGLFAALFSLKCLLFDHIDRVGLPITASIAYGQIAAILGLISFNSIFISNQLKPKILSIAGCLGAAFAVQASSSTGALLGFLAGVLTLLIFQVRDHVKSFSIFKTSIIVVALLGFAIPLVLKDFPTIYSDVFLTPPDSYMFHGQGHRLLLWSIALKEIVASPFVGIGPGHFAHVIDRYCQEHFCLSDFSGYRGVHNQFLDSAMNAGIVGFVGLIVSYIGPLILFLRRTSMDAPSCSSSNASKAGVAVIMAGMVSAFSQVLYGHNISVITYFFSITFLWFLADQKPDMLPRGSKKNQDVALIRS